MINQHKYVGNPTIEHNMLKSNEIKLEMFSILL